MTRLPMVPRSEPRARGRWVQILCAPIVYSSALAISCSPTPPTGDRDGQISLGDGDATGDGDGSGGDGDLAGDGDSFGDGDSTIDLGDGDGDAAEGDGDAMEPQEDCDQTLELIVRDFNADHPDMQRTFAGRDDVGCGMVHTDLFVGADGARTPQFFGPIGTGQRHIDAGVLSCIDWGPMAPAPPVDQYEIENETTFNQWYSDVAGVNSTFMVSLELVDQGDGTFVYDSALQSDGRFFPADGQGFNELVDSRGSKHNFHFTTEAHVRFGYHGGEVFEFSGDDDMWIFVNSKLALDLGGLHAPLVAHIDFDDQAAALGIEKGGVYNMDIFHAERRTDDSNYKVTTNIECFETVEVPTEVIR